MKFTTGLTKNGVFANENLHHLVSSIQQHFSSQAMFVNNLENTITEQTYALIVRRGVETEVPFKSLSKKKKKLK